MLPSKFATIKPLSPIRKPPVNRKKKINETLKKKAKKANAKKHKSNKPRYISKAERAEQQAAEASNQIATPTPDSESRTEG